ncbi:hypothetical protein [Marinobacter alexandrii]|uniref:hypothetical protein n=1 Tax=Marinobacter alexandrii TaxID=2570351 RepID=UPI001108A3D3|nr:hypothetical protein [Marinobacter alexandrii]
MTDSIRDVICDVRHSADVDNYTNYQRKFLWAVAERLEAAGSASPCEPADEAILVARKWLSMTETEGGHLHYDDITKMAQALTYTQPPSGVPEWMQAISENLHTQDNRITADPLFVVFQKTLIVVAEGYDHDRIVWVDDEGHEADEVTESQLNALRSDIYGTCFMEDEIELGADEREEWRRFAIKEVDQFVTACFTEDGAEAYLKINGHNLNRPFIYVTSLFRNEEMKELRNWLLSTNATPPRPADGWISEVKAERQRQDQKWGGPSHDDQHRPETFAQLIEDYSGWARVMAGMGSLDKYRRRMIQVAALAGAAVEATDRALQRAANPPEQGGE